MGAWGPAIFSDDTAADVRGGFRDLAAEGLSPYEATERLIAQSAEILADSEEANVFWLALAATQWSLGRLTESVRDRAIQIIDSGADLERWEEDPNLRRKRKQHLEKLRDQLNTPQSKPKKLKKRIRSSTDFLAGDLAIYCVSENISVKFFVTGLWGDRGGTYTNICLLGLEDGTRMPRHEIKPNDYLGPKYVMLMHEPSDLITMIERGLALPSLSPVDHAVIRECRFPHYRACLWKDFSGVLVELLPSIGWM